MTLTEECKAIERACPGWHVWRSDEGKVYATRVSHGTLGCGVTIPCHGIGRAPHEIAEYEHALACAERRERVRSEGWGAAA